MKVIELDKMLSEEEYFHFEEMSELKHELINNTLIEMSGITKFHNRVTLNLLVVLRLLLQSDMYELYFDGFKVKNSLGNFFYPDVVICKREAERYYTEEPVFILEVLSDSTRKYDLTDKFIQYQKIDTLEYYLCVEPEQQVVFFYYKHDKDWMAETFSKEDQIISLPKINISFSVKDIYAS